MSFSSVGCGDADDDVFRFVGADDSDKNDPDDDKEVADPVLQVPVEGIPRRSLPRPPDAQKIASELKPPVPVVSDK
ncbi:MAG: hypothetical protein KTR25_18055 [Myxococcales bacterium]|nr:hypothetical protein [Myxococcales bacterium]